VNGNKWIQINGEGNDPKNCKINWESSKDNEDMFIILTQEKVISPLCGWVKCNNPKVKNNIYIQVLKISPLIKDGYICKKYDVPYIEPPLPDPQIIIPEKEDEIETEKISINKSELLKAVNINTQSGEAGYALIPRSYDKEKRQKDEDDTIKDMQKWLEDQQDRLEDELKKMYPEL
jgi:hypothetical protein